MKRWTGILVLVAASALLFGAAACSDNNDDGDKAAEPTSSAGGETREITIVSSDTLAFDPADVTLTAGEPVRITLDNSDGGLLHDLTIEGMEATGISSDGAAHKMDGTAMPDGDHMATEMPGDGHMDDGMDREELHVAADPGGTGVLEFTPTSTGTFVYYCTVEGHRDAGMEGTITVE